MWTKHKSTVLLFSCPMGYSNMYWFESILLAVSLPKKQSPFYQNSTHVLKTHELISNTCTELPKYWSVQEQIQLSLYHKHYLRWDLNNFGARLSHSIMESTVTMVVLFNFGFAIRFVELRSCKESHRICRVVGSSDSVSSGWLFRCFATVTMVVLFIFAS